MTVEFQRYKPEVYGHECQPDRMQIAVRFEPHVFEELRDKARAQDVSMAEMIRRMVERGLWM